jgi:short-subunit dehydrogenase
MTKSILIIGAGSGVSLSVAKKFGSLGFRVLLLGRNEKNLKSLSDELTSLNIRSTFYISDVGSEIAFSQVLGQIATENEDLEVLYYNAASFRTINVLSESTDSLVKDFKINVCGLLMATTILESYLVQNKGSILVTGGGFALYPSADFASLSIGKAALRSLTFSLAEALKPKGVFVGTVMIKGMVSPEAEIHNPDNIAEKFYQLYLDKTETEIQL